jgi:hypothetical protein
MLHLFSVKLGRKGSVADESALRKDSLESVAQRFAAEFGPRYSHAMRKTQRFAAVLLFTVNAMCFGQIRRSSIPIGDAVDTALKKSSLTGENARPFHVRVVVSEPENPQSPYQGTIEEWWTSADQWRREVTAKGGMKQTIVVVNGKKSEKDEGDYFPLWLRSFVMALFDPVPDTAAWKAAGMTIDQITMPNGAKSDACARAQSKIGVGDRATDAFSNVCFDGEGRLKFVGSPRFSMEFHDYRKFGKKEIAHNFADDPEPGTALVGEIVQLDDGKGAATDIYALLATDDDRFRSIAVSPAQLEQMTAGTMPVAWPPVNSGNTRGRLAMYISIDSEGQVREAWPLNSDNAGLEDSAREQVKEWKIKPLRDRDGNPIQVDGGLGFSFETVIGSPVPVLTDEEARALVVDSVEPNFPPNALKPGKRYRIRVAVNEQGKFTGGAAGDTEVPGTEIMPGPGVFPVMMALSKWHFRPLMRDGKSSYFFAELIFEGK